MLTRGSTCLMQGLRPPVLVFVQSKERAKELHKELAYDGVKVEAIHADRTQAQVRRKLVREFEPKPVASWNPEMGSWVFLSFMSITPQIEHQSSKL